MSEAQGSTIALSIRTSGPCRSQQTAYPSPPQALIPMPLKIRLSTSDASSDLSPGHYLNRSAAVSCRVSPSFEYCPVWFVFL